MLQQSFNVLQGTIRNGSEKCNSDLWVDFDNNVAPARHLDSRFFEGDDKPQHGDKVAVAINTNTNEIAFCDKPRSIQASDTTYVESTVKPSVEPTTPTLP